MIKHLKPRSEKEVQENYTREIIKFARQYLPALSQESMRTVSLPFVAEVTFEKKPAHDRWDYVKMILL